MDKLICDQCESKQLKAENDALREQLEGLQKRFDQINNFEQSQCAKLLAEIAKRDKTLARVMAERDAAQAALKAMRFAYVNGDTDCPHQFEMDAMRQAKEILGEWPQKEDGRNGN